MKTHKIIAVFLLTIASGFISVFFPVQSRQVYATSEKSGLLPQGGKSIFVQEKSKYIYVGSEKCAAKCDNNDEMGFQ